MTRIIIAKNQKSFGRNLLITKKLYHFKSYAQDILTMFCADAEIPKLIRRLMNGERTG